MNRKIILIAAVIIMVFTSVSFASELPEEIDTSEATQIGYDLGYKSGKSVGTANASTFPPITVDEALPTDSELEDSYSGVLSGQPEEYVDAFVSAYKDGFRKGYGETIISVSYGATFGYAQGEISGAKDSTDGEKSNWDGELMSNKEITEYFGLDDTETLYRNNFISAYKENYKKGYEEAYENTKMEPFKLALDRGRVDGKTLGNILGSMDGSADYYNGLSIDEDRHMPSDREIVRQYSLYADTDDYEGSFITNFKDSYRTAYLNSFRDKNLSFELMDSQSAVANGNSVGVQLGQAKAQLDYTMKLDNDWERHKVSDSSIISEHNLLLQRDSYRHNFIASYWDGFASAYKSMFIELSQVESMSRTVVETFGIAGGSLASSSNSDIAIEIPQGTLYNNITVSMKTYKNESADIQRAKMFNGKSVVVTSDYLDVQVVNPSGRSNQKNDVTLAFEYYGDREGGIYKLVNGKWEYIPSTIEGNMVFTKMKLEQLNGGTFAVFIDEEENYLYDIRGHWAKDEITTFVKRKVVSGYPDDTFKPENRITRLEFIIMLSRLYDWDYTYTGQTTNSFVDSYNFLGYDMAVNYAVSRGYVNGYPDKTFRPKNHINYKEVEIIMRRVVGDFNWKEIEESIRLDKHQWTNSSYGMHNTITRAEVIYMFYMLDENTPK